MDEVTNLVIKKLQLDVDVLTLLKKRPEVKDLEVINFPDGKVMLVITGYSEIAKKNFICSSYYSDKFIYTREAQMAVVEVIIGIVKAAQSKLENDLIH